MLEDITGKESVDRLVSGTGVQQLLAIPKLPAGAGEAAASVIHKGCLMWDNENLLILQSIKHLASMMLQ